MTNKEFIKFCESIMAEIRKYAPKDTGNLAYNAIKMKMQSPRQCEIYVSGNSIKTLKMYMRYGIAPYMPFTNEPWRSLKWHGRKNPNEGWWQNAIEHAVYTVAKEYGGETEK